jgi:phytoene desaturase
MANGMKCVVIGGGFAGLTIAAELADLGWSVMLLEKNSSTGGRARLWTAEGFQFDMGPSWYLMPEVFDRFFERMGRDREDYYHLDRLDTYYKVFFEHSPPITVTKEFSHTLSVFNELEEQGGKKLKSYLERSAYKYGIAMKEFLYRDYRSLFQFFNKRMMTEGLKLNIFKSIDTFVTKYFDSQEARQILEYAMVFLGTAPKDAPALYSIMSHVDLNLGVWYPRGGLSGAAAGIRRLAEDKGAEIRTGCEVDRIVTVNGRVRGVECAGEFFPADAVAVSCDYHHADMDLLGKGERNYSAKYWSKRVLAPSMFIIYLGLGRRLESLEHHNLYFETNWNRHFDTIFKAPSWPENPCFYLSCNSKTDTESAPDGGENVFILVPVAPHLTDTDEIRNEYAESVLKHIEKVTGEDLHNDVLVKRIYSHKDFIDDYNALGGSALGLAHTLRQTAVFRPSRRSKKVKGLYFTGQYTHPGVGVPMTIISSEVTAQVMEKDFA